MEDSSLQDSEQQSSINNSMDCSEPKINNQNDCQKK